MIPNQVNTEVECLALDTGLHLFFLHAFISQNPSKRAAAVMDPTGIGVCWKMGSAFSIKSVSYQIPKVINHIEPTINSIQNVPLYAVVQTNRQSDPKPVSDSHITEFVEHVKVESDFP